MKTTSKGIVADKLKKKLSEMEEKTTTAAELEALTAVGDDRCLSARVRQVVEVQEVARCSDGGTGL